MKNGTFREDLYYHLKVIELSLPPLRGRAADIPLLVGYFIKRYNSRLNKQVLGVTDNAERLLAVFCWTGNVRKLEHVIEHGVLLSPGPLITVEDLPHELKAFSRAAPPTIPAGPDNLPEAILSALEKNEWNKAQAAWLLGIGLTSLYRKCKEYDLSGPTTLPERVPDGLVRGCCR